MAKTKTVAQVIEGVKISSYKVDRPMCFYDKMEWKVGLVTRWSVDGTMKLPCGMVVTTNSISRDGRAECETSMCTTYMGRRYFGKCGLAELTNAKRRMLAVAFAARIVRQDRVKATPAKKAKAKPAKKASK